MPKQIDFDRINKNLDKMARDLPRLAANAMLNHSKKAFRDQGFTDAALSPWAARKRGNAADRRTNKNRAILVDSGNLRRSLRVRKRTFSEIAVGSYGIPYAKRHNQGLAGMPQRRFVGRSKVLTKKLHTLAAREFRKAFNS